jgi:class 3 adenylate cyclase/tetratricopeptide (TPR) repeat protein
VEAVGEHASGPASGAERRFVSVLFADLVGFTTLSEHRDPEEVRDILTRYFDTSRSVVERYGGVVEKFIGDAVMALWGAPVAHEDDAERAVRAALELVDAVGALGREAGAADLRLRSGVLSGEAAVTIGALGQGMVAGDLVNTASRIQSLAEPGTVLVGESTYLAAREVIAFEPAGSHEVKGREAPVATWRALRVVTARRGARWTEALEPPFVGRDEEFRLVKDLYHATAREGRARLVSVTGIAGIGKSRLAWELFKYLDGVAETMYWHQGRSPAYGEGLTFWALAEMVRMRAHIAESEDPADSRRKLSETLATFVRDDAERRWIEPHLAQLLGLETGPAADREELFGAWRLLFERVADQGPVVLVFEDLQWADSGLIDFVEYVLEWSKAKPILILTLSRPELLDRRPTWGAGQRSFTSLHLDPLSHPNMRVLLEGMAAGLPEPLVARVLQRAEGVPLYAVETIRMLVDQGRLRLEGDRYEPAGDIEELGVPETLQSLIAARLDGLDPEDRRLLQDASVLGKTFTVASLAAMTGEEPDRLQERMRTLVRKEFLTLDVDPRSPERGQFGFVQSLIREVAYQMLSKRDRRTKHLAAAHFFESLQDDELAGAVANHYVEAHRASPEGPEADALAARAQDSLLSAATRAGALGSNGQALRFLERAMEITAGPEQLATIWERAGGAAMNAAEFTTGERYLRMALEHHETGGDLRAIVRSTVALSRAMTMKGEVLEAIELMEPRTKMAEELGTEPEAVEFSAELSRVHMMNLDGVRSLEWADRALAEAERQGLVATVAEVLATKGSALAMSGRPREGTALLWGAIRLAREQGFHRQELRAINNLTVQLFESRPAEAFEVAGEGIEAARRVGMRDQELQLSGLACVTALSTGRWPWVRSTVDELWSPEMAGDSGNTFSAVKTLLAAYTGQVDEAERSLDHLHGLTSAASNPQMRVGDHWIGSTVDLTTGRLEGAFEQGLLLIAGDPSTPAFNHLSAFWPAAWLRDPQKVGELISSLRSVGVSGDYGSAVLDLMAATRAMLEGRTDEGGRAFGGVWNAWRGLGCVFELAMSELTFVTLASSDDPAAGPAADEAREIFERLGARPFLERLEAARSALPA